MTQNGKGTKQQGISNEILSAATGVRTFQCVANVTGYLEGEFDDWPANIQDGILLALDKLAEEVEVPVTIIFSKCDRDWGSTDEDPRWYVQVIASEIVVTNSVLFRDEKEKMKAIIADIVAGRRTQ